MQTYADGRQAYRIQYYTTENRMGISFVFVSMGDEASAEEEAFMQKVIERVVY